MENKDSELLKLEKEKLRLEVRDLKRWYLNPLYLRIIVTLAIAGLTIIITYNSGIIDVKKERLEFEKAKLSEDINDFETVRTLLQDSIKTFRDSLSEMRRREIAYLKEYKAFQSKEELYIQKLREENEKDQIIEYYKSRLDSLVKLRTFDETFDPYFK